MWSDCGDTTQALWLPLQPILPFVQESLTGPRFVPLSINGVSGVTGRPESDRGRHEIMDTGTASACGAYSHCWSCRSFSFAFARGHKQLRTTAASRDLWTAALALLRAERFIQHEQLYGLRCPILLIFSQDRPFICPIPSRRSLSPDTL
jgi:hypothetical protein